MTSNDDTSGKNTLTISVMGEDGQRHEVTFNVPLHHGKRLSELTMGEVLPPDLLAQLESMPAVMPVTSEEGAALGDVVFEAEAMMAGSQFTDNTPIFSPPQISQADLRAVYEHTAKHCPLCGQLIPGNTEGATDVVN